MAASLAYELSEKPHTAGDLALLAGVVKKCQRDKLAGSRGQWKAFLQAAHPEQQRADPAQNSWPVLTEFLGTLTQEQQTTLLLPLASPAPARAPKLARSRPVPGKAAVAVQAAQPQPTLVMAPVVAPVAAAGPATPVGGSAGADSPRRLQTAAAVPAMPAAAGSSQPGHKRERAEPSPGAEQGTVHPPEAPHRKKARKVPQATRALAAAEAPQAARSVPVPQRVLANGHAVAAVGQESAVSKILQESTMQEAAEVEAPVAEVLAAKLPVLCTDINEVHAGGVVKLLAMAMLSQAAVVQESQPAANMHYIQDNGDLVSNAVDVAGSVDAMNSAAVPQESAWNLATRSHLHPKFAGNFKLPPSGLGWATVSRQADIRQPPELLAIDCEMCEVAGNKRELLGLSVINAARQTVLKMLVRPVAPVLDYRTAVTGLTAADLQGVAFRHADAQRAVVQLMAQPNAVLVGHSLHHDLQALKIGVTPASLLCIDTSFLWGYRNLQHATPSLADLVQQVLGRQLRQEGVPHDCERDALAAMELVLHGLRHGCSQDLTPPATQVPKESLKKLMVHSLPAGVLADDLLQLFAAVTCDKPTAVEGSLATEQKGYVVFKHVGEANEAFKQLAGAEETDSLGRKQKQLRLTSGSLVGQLVRVRKLAAHSGKAFGKDASKGKGHARRRRV